LTVNVSIFDKIFDRITFIPSIYEDIVKTPNPINITVLFAAKVNNTSVKMRNLAAIKYFLRSTTFTIVPNKNDMIYAIIESSSIKIKLEKTAISKR